eukprot:TRINITY_DN1139_c0_g2_i1.p1 TRINITY_DN1139_c0_g2~~TRINITY_DN1139_c0_g2_i1.p1  ORF type:complete len:281 (+),score=96.66 TRINITY_DN1139_c0_g2_i1:88-843(+)
MALRAGLLRPTRVLSVKMGQDLRRPGEGFNVKRIPVFRNVMMMKPYVERGMPLLYPRWYEDAQEPLDHNYVLFNRPERHTEKIGVVTETMNRTAVVAVRYFVRYKNFAKVVSRIQRCWAHDEDNACVAGDVVQIKRSVRRGKFKTYLVQSILEPNIEGRERLKKDLPVMPKAVVPNSATGWKPLFDFSRDDKVNEEEQRRAEQLATDIHRTDADYDGGLADRTGKDKWAFLDDDFMMDDDEADVDAEDEAQ